MIIIFLFVSTCLVTAAAIAVACNGESDDKTIASHIGFVVGLTLLTTVLAAVFFPVNVNNSISNEKLELIENIKWIDENVRSDIKEDMMKKEVEKYNNHLSSSGYYYSSAIIYCPFHFTVTNNIKSSTIDIDSITMDNYMEIILKSEKEDK